MDELAQNLLEELNCETVFTIHTGLGDLEIAESVVITWVIMALILLVSVFLTRNLKVHPESKRQLVAESIVTWLEKFVTGMVGEEGKRYAPYLISVLIYIGISNVIGLFGLKPPTKDMNVTAALAIMSIVLIEYAGTQKGRQRMAEKLYAAYCDCNTDQYSGSIYQAAFPVHAIIR